VEQSLRDAYLALDTSMRALVLARVAHNLTLVLRAHYSDPPTESLKALAQGQNEVMHSLTGHIRDLLAASPTYPEDVFLQIVIEKAEHADLSANLSAMFREALARA
jgi:hypothetical protein